MPKEKLLEILDEWNFWSRGHDTGFPREEYLNKIKQLTLTGQIVVVTGIRRSGKSTIMQQYISSLIKSGVQPRNILYVNFEDLRFKNVNLELLQQIYEIYQEYLQPELPVYIFLDEVHRVEGWEQFVRTLHELKRAHLFVSGSNSRLLFGKLAPLLTGRHLDLTVSPLTFKEFLFFKGMSLSTKLDLVSKRLKIQNQLDSYLKWGGLPLVCLKESKEELLSTYFEDIIHKDILNNHTISNISKLNSLAKYYLTNIGRRVSFNNLSKLFGLSLDTIERYSYYSEEACLINFIKKFSFSVKEQERTMAIVYAVDNGLRNVVGFSFSQDRGWLYQNTVANNLFKKYGKNNIFYWMSETQEEVDFLVKIGTKIQALFQVCLNLEDDSIKKREIKSLLKAGREFKCRNLSVITEDYENTEKIGGDIINYIPLWKWLLEE